MTNLQPGTTMYRIAELERIARELRGDVRELRGRLATAERRIREMEHRTPQARQAAYEADLANADLAASGYDKHGRGCDCPECYYEPGDIEPGHPFTPGEWRGRPAPDRCKICELPRERHELEVSQ